MANPGARALPDFSRQEFGERLAKVSPTELPPATIDALHGHFLELRRWNPRLSLIGPGTVERVVELHYGESLAALPLLASRSGRLLDLGSGAGFPGLVLAAAQPDLAVTLVEARQRKWAFLEQAARQASIPCSCLQARVGRPLPPALPQRVNFITLRALKLPVRDFEAVLSLLSPEGRVLLWTGRESPPLPPRLQEVESRALPGNQSRRILVLRQ